MFQNVSAISPNWPFSSQSVSKNVSWPNMVSRTVFWILLSCPNSALTAVMESIPNHKLSYSLCCNCNYVQECCLNMFCSTIFLNHNMAGVNVIMCHIFNKYIVKIHKDTAKCLRPGQTLFFNRSRINILKKTSHKKKIQHVTGTPGTFS